MNKIGEQPKEQAAYPAQVLVCNDCKLVQLGLIVDPKILFPSTYPYTSGTTQILRENFADLYQECTQLIDLTPDDLVVDIGSNDGTLLSNFSGAHQVQGITPENIGKLAIEKGIPTLISYFDSQAVSKVIQDRGKAKIVTATNVFAHIQDVHSVLDSIIDLLDDSGVFISESHYLMPLIETLQYDTIYHEHLRYYSLHSLKFLLNKHGLDVFHIKEIPTHGGSIRVYAARKGRYPTQPSVQQCLDKEKKTGFSDGQFKEFGKKVSRSKLALYSLLHKIKDHNQTIYGIGAPSRASTLVNYVGLDEQIMDCVLEIKGSYKIGYYMPGTLIPIIEESKLFEDQPEYALMLSWHIADELAPKLKKKGFKGDFIVPLPMPRIIKNSDL